MFENIIREKLRNHVTQTAFDITTEKNRFKSLGAELPAELIDLNTLNRDKVTEIINSPNYSVQAEFLGILFWGYFFTVNYKRNKIRFLEWLNEPNSTSKLEFIKSTIQNSDDPNKLFKSFTKKDQLKIPGLGYAYFTKLFYYYTRERDTVFPILDKWLSIGWIVLSNELVNDEALFYYKNKDNRLGSMQRRQSEGYAKYVQFMNETARKFNSNVESLEIAMFGSDRREDTTMNNIRNQYLRWLIDNNFNI